MSRPSSPIRIALVDDYDVVVIGLAHMLAPFGDRITVVELDVQQPVSGDVDIVSGVGFDKVDERNPAFDSLNIHRVVTNLGVFDFGGPSHQMRAVSLHPGVTASEVSDNTTFEVHGLAEAPVTREPTVEELRLIREVIDPKSLRDKEVRA